MNGAKLRTALTLGGSALHVALRRLARGPRRPGWPFFFEVMTSFLGAHLRNAGRLPTPALQRAYLDALDAPAPAVAQVRVEPVAAGSAAARWFVPPGAHPRVRLLYCHGGGYCFNSRGQDNLVALVALAAGVRTLALDYRLAPEHPCPAAIEDGCEGYRFLLRSGVEARHVAVAGDSAGGGLTAAVLVALRDAGDPLPAVGVLLSPWVDMADDFTGVTAEDVADWIDPAAVPLWREWYLGGRDATDPVASPLRADLRGLPPLYVQAGGAEGLRKQIRSFADKGRAQGVDVTLDEWDHMNHVFQAFGPALPQSADALARLGKKIRDTAG